MQLMTPTWLLMSQLQVVDRLSHGKHPLRLMTLIITTMDCNTMIPTSAMITLGSPCCMQCSSPRSHALHSKLRELQHPEDALIRQGVFGVHGRVVAEGILLADPMPQPARTHGLPGRTLKDRADPLNPLNPSAGRDPVVQSSSNLSCTDQLITY